MAIITNNPRFLNLDNDSRIVEQNEMIDALNVRVSTDDGGNQGVVKNIKGSSSVSYDVTPYLGQNQVVGTYEHEGTNRLFVFVWNSNGHHSIYKIEHGESSFTLIIRSQQILMSNNPLHIDGIMVSGKLFLYFTDGVNEPQKVNVDSGIDINSYPSFSESMVMKKSPDAPQVTWSNDTSRVTNELYGKSFQFALQYVYRDGEVSAIGEYSDNTVGLNTLSATDPSDSYKNQYNKITLEIGTGTLGSGFGTAILEVRLFFRDVNTNTMFYIGEYTATEIFNGVDFFNDESYSVVSDAEFNKIQDAVPKVAKAQTISANRLFYGNYKEGFDKANVSAVLSPVYGDEPENKKLKVVSSIPPSDITAKVSLNTEEMQGLLNGTDGIPTLVAFKFRRGTIHSFEERAMDLVKPSGSTFKSFTVSSSEAAEPNRYTSLSVQGTEYSHQVTLGATASYSAYNNALASSIDGTSIVCDLYAGSAWFNDNSNYSWKANFEEGTVTLDVNAVATSTGVDITFTPSSFIVSGTKATGKANVVLITQTVIRDYSSTLSGVFGATDAENIWSIFNLYSNQSSASVTDYERTFKNGDNHSFGVVFEDSLGRATGVYEIGSLSIPQLYDRDANQRGRVSVESTLTATGLDASLLRYFYVYNGGSVIEDYTQYSVAEGFVIDNSKVDEAADSSILIALRTLQGTPDSYCATEQIDYTFTEGDELRIISYIDEDGVRLYPNNVVFEVEGLRKVTSEEDILLDVGTMHDERRYGDFLVLKNENQADFGRTDIIGGTDLWKRHVVVEILTKKKGAATKIYRAVSGKYAVTSLGATDVIAEGNAWYKRRNVLMPTGLTSGGNAWSLTPESMYLESNQYYDRDRNSVGQLGGKPYGVINNEQEQDRISSITYSDPQFADSSQNNISSFNNSLANFSDYEMNYGGIFGLVDSSDSITVLQSDKVSRVPVSRQILSTGSGSEFVTQSTDILGLQQHYPINAGINEDRTAFLKSNGAIYIVDVTRAKMVSFSSQGIKVLSDMGVSSFVEERSSSMLADSNGYFVSIGEDKENKEIIFSLQNKPQDFTKSIVYSTKLDKFSSFVSYTSSYYGSLGLRKFAFREVDSQSIPVGHELEVNSTYGNFFGNQYDSEIKVSFNSSPSLKKVYQAFSIDGDKKAALSISTVDQSATVSKSAFVERENSFFVDAPSAAGSSEYVVLGVVSAESDPDITFSSRVNRMPFKLGGDAYTFSSSVYNNLSGCVVDGVVDSKTLSFTNAGSISIGDVIAIKGDSSIDGDAIRGAFAEVKFTFDNTDKMEIFSVSASVANSSVHNSPSSQQ